MKANCQVTRFLNHIHKHGLRLEYKLTATSNPERVNATLAIVTKEGSSVGIDDANLSNLIFPAMILYKGRFLQEASLATMTAHFIQWLKQENFTIILAKNPYPLWPMPKPQRNKKTTSK